MNQDTIDKLKAIAPSIERFRNLHPDEQKWLIHLLSPTTLAALNMLDAIANQPMTFDEISKIVERNPQTVSQTLNALNEGGVNIDLTEKTAFAPTGRPRKLARR